MTILEYSEPGKNLDASFIDLLRELKHENTRLQHLVAELLAKNERLRNDPWISASASDTIGPALRSSRLITD